VKSRRTTTLAVGAVALLLAGCGQDTSKLEARVAKLEEQVSGLRTELDRARMPTRREDVEQKRLVPEPGAAPEAPPKTDAPVPAVPAPPETRPDVKGQILAADSAMDIYLVSVGRKEDVRVGDELTVYRGDTFVAVVVVDHVFEDKASVVVKKVSGKAMKKSDIKAGDKVARSLL